MLILVQMPEEASDWLYQDPQKAGMNVVRRQGDDHQPELQSEATDKK